jgi:ATP-dependent DNA helicase RecQ
MLRPGTGLVISPLIALMADQVSGLRQLGVAAARLDSNLEPAERRRVLDQLDAGALDLLYVSPEGVAQPGLIERLQVRPLSVVAIDEAHCVSQWGHDFRPDYRGLGRLADLFPGVPRIAVTATADARTREDIRTELRLGDAHEYVDTFARPELRLAAEAKNGSAATRVESFVKARPGRSGVVYVGSRAGADTLAERLRGHGAPALAYHAGLDKGVRSQRLEQFLGQENAVMVATIAFGMGIDKPNVRYVVHADPPASIEAYWQEIGRAGRDGAAAEGLTLYGASDFAFALRRIQERELSEAIKPTQIRKLRQLYAFLEGASCRAAGVRRYFGETDAQPCGQCDLCLEPPVLEDATEAAQMALSAVHRLNGQLGRGRIVDHLLGRGDKGGDREAALPTFGVGKALAAERWRTLVDHLFFEGLIEEDPNDGRPVLRLGDLDRVRSVYRRETEVQIRRAAAARPSSRRRAADTGDASAEDNPLFEALRAWRRLTAADQKLPPYVIFHDKTLWEIAQARPSSLAALGLLSGVGQGKLDRYGGEVITLVRAHASPG